MLEVLQKIEIQHNFSVIRYMFSKRRPAASSNPSLADLPSHRFDAFLNKIR
jgi:hypothetical protein